MRRQEPREPRPSLTGANAADDAEPLTGGGFRVEIDGLSAVRAVEVIFPEARIVAERAKRVVRYGPLTLRRALAGSNDWYEWWDAARNAGTRPIGVARTVRVVVTDRAHVDVGRWTFQKTRPIAYSLSPLNALVSAPLIETMELSVGGFDAAFHVPPR